MVLVLSYTINEKYIVCILSSNKVRRSLGFGGEPLLYFLKANTWPILAKLNFYLEKTKGKTHPKKIQICPRIVY